MSNQSKESAARGLLRARVILHAARQAAKSMSHMWPTFALAIAEEDEDEAVSAVRLARATYATAFGHEPPKGAKTLEELMVTAS